MPYGCAVTKRGVGAGGDSPPGKSQAAGDITQLLFAGESRRSAALSYFCNG